MANVSDILKFLESDQFWGLEHVYLKKYRVYHRAVEGLMSAEPNDALVILHPQGGEVYIIEGFLFCDIYQLDDRRHHCPTQVETIEKWSALLQNQAGSLHFESRAVFAKKLLDTRDISPKPVEDTVVVECGWSSAVLFLIPLCSVALFIVDLLEPSRRFYNW